MQGQLATTQRLKDVMGDFAVAVHHLTEWLHGDAAAPNTVGERARQHVNSDPLLRLAVAVSNSHKHHTRDGGVQAHISSPECDARAARRE